MAARIDEEKLIRLYKEGIHAPAEIAAKMGVPRSTIHRAFKRLGLSNIEERASEGVTRIVRREIFHRTAEALDSYFSVQKKLEGFIARLEALIRFNAEKLELGRGLGEKEQRLITTQLDTAQRVIGQLLNVQKQVLEMSDIHNLKEALLKTLAKVSPEARKVFLDELQSYQLNLASLRGSSEFRQTTPTLREPVDAGIADVARDSNDQQG